jgi:hypothetical protein
VSSASIAPRKPPELGWNLGGSASLNQQFQAGGKQMLRGGLLWLIGIPLPIILILFFLGYLS